MSLLCRYVTVASNESRFLFNLTEKEKNVTSFSAIRIEERKSDVENYVSTFCRKMEQKRAGLLEFK